MEASFAGEERRTCSKESVPWVWALLVLGVCAPLTAQTTKKVSFANDVAPILSRACMKCHGLASPMANLDLRTRAGALKGGQHGPAIVPGNAAASLLYKHVAGQEQPQMPLGGKLSAEEIAVLKSWIDSGADWDSSVALSSDAAPCLGRHRKEVHGCPAELLGFPEGGEAGRAFRESQELGSHSGRRIHPGKARREESQAESACRQDHAPPAGLFRSDRLAAHAGTGSGLSGRQFATGIRESGRPSCWPRRTTASAGAATGWTWPAMPTRRASRPTRRGPTSGAIATT